MATGNPTAEILANTRGRLRDNISWIFPGMATTVQEGWNLELMAQWPVRGPSIPLAAWNRYCHN